jgi:YY1-associated factor 2
VIISLSGSIVCFYININIFIDFILGTSTRKPRLNSALVSAQQAATMQSPGGLPGASGSSKSSNKISKNKNKRSKYVRLKNIDRSTGQTREVTVNNVTICITEYKAKINNRDSHSRHDSSDYSESNDSRS